MKNKKFPELVEESTNYLVKVVQLLSKYIPEKLKEEVFEQVDFKKQVAVMKEKRKIVADTPDAKLAYLVGKENGMIATILAMLLPEKELKREKNG